MESLSPGLAAHLAGGVTTLCRCWRVERKDGMVMGVTDHDRDLVFDGLIYRAATGFTATVIEDQQGLAVSNLDVEGALLASDDFTLKLSPDASSFFVALRGHKDLHGRLAVKDAGRSYPIRWRPRAGTTTIDVLGLGASNTGTIAVVAPTSSNLFTQSIRNKITSAATAGSAATLRGAQLCLWRGNSTGLGGFFLCMHGDIETFQATCRMFMGLYSAATDIGNVNPSALLNMVGIGVDSGQTTLRLLRNDGSGTATAVDLGAGFPTTGSQILFELILSAEPNGSEIRYRIERLNSGALAEGVLTSDLPVATQFLTPHFWLNNGTTAAAVELSVVSLYAEPASLLGSRGSVL